MLSEDHLTTKAEELQSLLIRCSSILNDSTNDTLTTATVSKSSAPEVTALQKKVQELKCTVSELKQQIVTLKGHQEPLEVTVEPTKANGGNVNQELVHVFSYLSTSDLFRVGRVCKTWREASMNELLWKRLIVSDCSLNSQGLVAIATRCSKTRHVTLQGLSPLPAGPHQDLKSYIQQQKAGLEVGLDILLRKCGQGLISLTISECSLLITERSLWIISNRCPHLESLCYYSTEYPLIPESIWCLTNGCTKLQSLHIIPTTERELSQKFNDQCLHHISSGFPILTHITIGGVGVSLKGIFQLACLTRLQYIDIINGPRINLNAANQMSTLFPSLTHLCLTHTNITPQAVVRLIDTHLNLQVLAVTVSFSDYFTNNDETTVDSYSKIMSNFEKIKDHERYGYIFHLNIQ